MDSLGLTDEQDIIREEATDNVELGVVQELELLQEMGLMNGLAVVQKEVLIGEVLDADQVRDFLTEEQLDGMLTEVVLVGNEDKEIELVEAKYRYVKKYNILIVFMLILGISFVTVASMLGVSFFLFQESLNENQALTLQNLTTTIEKEEITSVLNEVADALIEVCKVTTIINSENELLLEACQVKDEMIQVYETREFLFDLYEYAIIDSVGNRTDVKYDDIIMLQELIEEKEMSEDVVNLILAIVMTESGGNQEAVSNESTAIGLGQFLIGTGDFVYRHLMNNSSYVHEEMASNGTTNLRMMVYYIEYLNDIYGGDLDKVINSYRGLDSPLYKARINYYLAKSNLSLNSIQIKENL